MWSLRFNAIGTTLLGWIAVYPSVIADSWNMLPAETKAYVPEKYLFYVAITLFLLGMVSRVIDQKKIPKC